MFPQGHERLPPALRVSTCYVIDNQNPQERSSLGRCPGRDHLPFPVVDRHEELDDEDVGHRAALKITESRRVGMGITILQQFDAISVLFGVSTGNSQMSRRNAAESGDTQFRGQVPGG